MAGAFSDLTASIKTIYPDTAIEAFVNDEQVVLKKIRRDIPVGHTVNGGSIVVPARLNPPQNQAWILDGTVLPYMKDRTQVNFTFTPRMAAAGFEIGWMTQKVLNSKTTTFGGGEQPQRVEETASNLGKFIEQEMVGVVDGIRGYVLADGSNTVTLKVANTFSGDMFLRENNMISVRVSAGGAARDSLDGRKVTSIVTTTGTPGAPSITLTYDGADQTAVANDPIYVVSDGASITGGAVQVLTSAYPDSIRKIVDGTTHASSLFGLTKATYPKMQSQVFSNGGTLRELDEQILLDAFRVIANKSGKYPETILSNYGQSQAFAKWMAKSRMYPSEGRSGQGYASGYKPEDIVFLAPGVSPNWILSHDVVPRELFILNLESFVLIEALKPSWMDDQDLHLTPASGRFKASYQAFMGAIQNLGCINPYCQGVVRDLADPIYGDVVGSE